MIMDWNVEQIRRFAPDLLTLERSEALLKPSRWKNLGCKDSLIWGQCRSGGLAWYQVALELEKGRFFSNSPSTRVPDKYVLALVTWYVKYPDRFTLASDIPEWVKDGFRRQQDQGRTPAHEMAAQKERARVRAREKRLLLMHEGVRDLEQWLEDLVREGLGSWYSRDEAQWEAIAARLVDQKLGGVARQLRTLYTQRDEANWLDRFAQWVADTYLFVQAFKELDDWSDDRQQDLLSWAGVKVRQSELLEEQGVSDFWLILSREEGAEEALRWRRSWLWGESTQQPALLLDFAWGDQAFQNNWQVGAAMQANLVFYPGTRPYRAVVKSWTYEHRPFARLSGAQNLHEFAHAFSQDLARNPWLRSYPCLLAHVCALTTQDRQFCLQDQDGFILPLAPGKPAHRLLALSGGRRLMVFGEWNGDRLRPLLAVTDQRLVPLQYPQATPS